MAEDVEFDKNKGLREIILFKVREAANDLAKLYYNDPHESFDHQNNYCLCFCICLEQCLTWGLKSSSFFVQRSFYDFLRKGIDACGDPGLRSSFETANALLLSKDGKTRAWIRLCLNQGTLAENLYALAANRRFVTSWYDPWSIISTNALNDLHEITQSLSQIAFEFKLRDRTLDKSSIFEKGPEHFRAIHNLKSVVRNKEPVKRKKKKKKKKKRQIEIDNNIEKKEIEKNETPVIDNIIEETTIQEQQKSDSDDEIEEELEENFESIPDVQNDSVEIVMSAPKEEEKINVSEGVDTSKILDSVPNKKISSEVPQEQSIKEVETKAQKNCKPVAAIKELKFSKPKEISIRKKKRTYTADSAYLTSKKASVRRKNSAIQVMRTLGKPVHNTKRSMSTSKPSTILPKIQADEVQFKPPASAVKRKSMTPIETLPMYHFPESGEYSRDEEKFEEKLLAGEYESNEVIGDIDTSLISKEENDDNDFIHAEVPTTPVFRDLEAPFLEEEEQTATIIHAHPPSRKRGITMHQGLETDFEWKIFGAIPVMSLEGDYFSSNNSARDKRREEQNAQRMRKHLEEQSFLRDQHRTFSNCENTLPSTGLILSFPPVLSKRDTLLQQNNRCFGCDSLIDTSYSARCTYTGKMYCNECLDGKLSFHIPHLLLSQLDQNKYVVSTGSYKHLSSMYSVPAIPLSQLQPELPLTENRLKAVHNFLKQLSVARDHVYQSEYRKVVVQKLEARAYLLESYASDRDSFPQPGDDSCCGMISMQDFIQIFDGDFLYELKSLIYLILQTLQNYDNETWQNLRHALGS